MLIVLYVTFIYIRERKLYDCKKKNQLFECLLLAGIFSIAFDGITAYTVNHQEQVPGLVNGFLHLCFLCSLDVIVFLMFLYMLNMSRGLPESRGRRLLLLLPLAVNIGVVILFIPQLTYRRGRYTSYSMGVSAYACFAMVAVYLIAAVAVLLHGWKNLERHKRITVTTYLLASVGVSAYQMLQPEALITSLVPAIAVVGTYLNIENPLFTKLRRHNNEMVMGFATLVEKRDDNTGGHIRRTTEYVRMLAEELRRRGNYREAMPLQECFAIIQEGRGRDFDPVIADAFLDMREEIQRVYEALKVEK